MLQSSSFPPWMLRRILSSTAPKLVLCWRIEWYAKSGMQRVIFCFPQVSSTRGNHTRGTVRVLNVSTSPNRDLNLDSPLCERLSPSAKFNSCWSKHVLAKRNFEYLKRISSQWAYFFAQYISTCIPFVQCVVVLFSRF